jgi:hypothetical protein
MKCDWHSDLPRRVFLASLFLCFCLGAAGCGYTCVVGSWNGSGAEIGGSNNACPLAKATGAISVRLSSIPYSASGFSSSTSSPQVIQHIFVALRGIQAHGNVDAAEGSSGWQELVPDLVVHPIQIDLLALNKDRFRSDLLTDPIATTIVPADEYLQIRFRLLPAEPSSTDALPEGNACGNAGWNCIILKDGSVWALAFGANESEIRFVPINTEKSLFRILPNGLTSLSLQFDPPSLLALRSGEAVRVFSTFKVSSDFRFPSYDQTKNLAPGNPWQTSSVDP